MGHDRMMIMMIMMTGERDVLPLPVTYELASGRYRPALHRLNHGPTLGTWRSGDLYSFSSDVAVNAVLLCYKDVALTAVHSQLHREQTHCVNSITSCIAEIWMSPSILPTDCKHNAEFHLMFRKVVYIVTTVNFWLSVKDETLLFLPWGRHRRRWFLSRRMTSH
jgi:hypothetical protein